MLPFETIGDHRRFEELCYDLVTELRFHNVRWRGPGADGGRDIEAEWYYSDPSGHFSREEWYIECKYYSSAVPFAEIEPKLLAASRDNKDCLLVITSSALMNTCLDSVDAWVRHHNGRPRFRYWNGQDLSKRLLENRSLLQKYFAGLSASGDELLKQAVRARDSVILGVDQRLGSDLLSLAQSISGRLAFANSRGNLARAQDEMVLLSSLLQSLRALVQAPMNASMRPVRLPDVLELVVRTSQRRVKLTLGMPEVAVWTKTSYPLLVAAAHELATNASMYGNTQAAIELSVEGPRWKLRFRNDHSENIEPEPWPRLGWRGPEARRRHPSRSGQGCWIAHAISSQVGIEVKWDRRPGAWDVELSGLTVEEG